MPPRRRKLAPTAHVTASVGWLGAVAGFLALAVAGLTGRDAQTVRAAYLAMEETARFVILPLALASVLTGLAQSLGTPWGLIRHYWDLVKLLLTVLATAVLLLQMEPIGSIAGVAAETTLSRADLREARMSLVATVLSVYKLRGMIPYRRRKQHGQRTVPVPCRCSDSCSALTERTEPVKPGDTIRRGHERTGQHDRRTRARQRVGSYPTVPPSSARLARYWPSKSTN